MTTTTTTASDTRPGPSRAHQPDSSALYTSPSGYRRAQEHYERFLRRLAIPHEARYIQTEFGLTHVLVAGSPAAKPVVLWHGSNANATTWKRWLEALAPDYRLYAVDTIGELGRSAPTRLDKTNQDYGRWAAETLAGLGLRRANMVGVSNGSWLTLKLAGFAPEMVGSALLLSAAGFRPISRLLALKLLPAYLRSPEAAAQRFLALLSAPGVCPDPELVKLFALFMRDFRVERKPAPMVGDAEIRRLSAPTAVLMGQHEVAFNPHKVLARARSLLPNLVAAQIISGTGHMLTEERPELLLELGAGFLKRYAVS